MRHEVLAIPVQIRVSVVSVQQGSSCKYDILWVVDAGVSSVAIGVQIVLVRDDAEGSESWFVHLGLD